MKRQLVARFIYLSVIFLNLAACTFVPSSSPIRPLGGTSVPVVKPTPVEPTREASRPTETFCILDPDGGTFGSHGGAFGSHGGVGGDDDVLHGDLVWSTIEAALGDSGAISVTDSAQVAQRVDPVVILVTDEFSGTSANLVERQALWQLPDQGDILVVGLDMHNFVVSEATQGLSAAINSFTRGTNVTLSNGLKVGIAPVDRFVVNMSWMIVPCDTIPTTTEEYLLLICDANNAENVNQLDELDSFQVTLKSLSYGNAEDFCEDVRARKIDLSPNNSRLTRSIEAFAVQPEARRLEVFAINEVYPFLLEAENDPNEPLHNLLNCFDRESQLSGNCLQINSQAPLSVNNLQTLTNNRIVPYTVINVAAAGNSGAPYPFLPAMMDSVIAVSASDTPVSPPQVASYSNWGEIQMPGEHPDGVHEGTSMSAPRLSVVAAKYLLEGGTSPCADDTSIKPVLGFKKKGDRIDLMAANDVNLVLTQAVAKYCTSFPAQ